MVAEPASFFISEDEYLRREETSLTKHEFVNGAIYAMAGASPTHNDLAMAASVSLGTQLRGKPCVPRGSDQRVKVEATGINTYPDVVVACPPLRYDSRNITLLDAAVIIEVLSPSTAEYDRTGKFLHYAQLPSLRHYVLVSQDQILVEHRRRDGAKWTTEFHATRDENLTLDAIDCTLSLADLYARLDVPSALDVAPPDENKLG